MWYSSATLLVLSKTAMAKYPCQITIRTGAMALDGGTQYLHGHDEAGRPIDIYLGWSMEQQDTGMTEFAVNGTLLLPGSEGEAAWLRLMKNAIMDGESDRPQGGTKVDLSNATFGTPDIEAFFKAAEQGPNAALRQGVDQVISCVLSTKHQNSRARPSVLGKIVYWIFRQRPVGERQS